MSSVRKLCILIILLCIVFAVQIMAIVRDPVAVIFAIVMVSLIIASTARDFDLFRKAERDDG